MKTQQQINSELEQIQINIERLKALEVEIQTAYFISIKAPDFLSQGTLDRIRAITDNYLNQFTWDGTRLVSVDPPQSKK